MLDWQKHKKLRLFIKTICIVLIISFLSYDLSWAGATEVLNPKNWQSAKESQNTPSIDIPQELGTIKESYTSKYNPYKLVIHIQDAHANIEAQENEAKLIKHLKDKYKINLVSVEGGFGDFDAEFFRSFPKDKKVRDKIARYFLSKAFISGTDYLLITEDEPPAVYGAEDRELYANHLNTFKENQNFSDSLNKSLNIVEEVIETLKNKYYSKDLKELDAKINDFRQGRISLEEYLSYLNISSIIHDADLSEFPNLYSLITSQELEHKIDFAKAETERQDLIESLAKALSKADLEELVKNSLEFKANKLTPREYYAYLEELTQKAGIETFAYTNLFTYIKYITLSENLDNSKVFNEIDEFTQTLKEKLAFITVQKDIDNLTYIIRILKGLSDINLSPKEYEYFKKTREDFNQRRLTWLFKRYVDSSYLKSLPSDEEIASLEKFYDLAQDRDKAIVSNSLNRLNREYSTNAVILVAGGFHTQGITSILKEKDVSYIVIAPNIKTTQDKEATYFALLKDKRIPLEDVLNDPDTLQIINSISDPEARQLLVNYWVARASRYYSTKELQAQLDRLRLSDGDQKAVEVALKEISSNAQFAKKEEPATQEDIVPKAQSIYLSPTLFERFTSFIFSLKPKPKEIKLAKQETILTSHKEEKQEGIIAGKEKLSSAPLPAQNRKSSSPLTENLPRQESIVNPAAVIPKGQTLIERFTGFIASLKPKPKPKKIKVESQNLLPVETKIEPVEQGDMPQTEVVKEETASLQTNVSSELTHTQQLAELFRNQSFDEQTQVKALAILDTVLKEEGLGFSLSNLRTKFLQVTRQLFLRPDTKAQELIQQFGLTKNELIDIYQILRLAKPLQDLIVDETEYAGFVNEIKDLLKYSNRLEKIFANQVVYPVIVEWHPGETCDSNCIFCFSRGMHYRDREQGRESLSLERAKELLQEFVDNGVREFWVSGGKEPLTNPITAQVIQFATDLGLIVRFYTNGIRLDRTTQKKILGCKQIRISINGATSETYQKVHGINSDNFQRVVRNIRDLVGIKKQKKAKVRVGMSFLLTPYNYNEILKIAKLAKDLGVDFLSLRTDMIGAIRRFNEDEVKEILGLVEELKINQEIGYYNGLEIDIRSLTEKDLLGERHYLPDMEKAKTCRVRMIKMGMNPYGVCYMCEYAEHPRNAKPELEIGDVTKMGFREILEQSIQIQHDPSQCDTCTINEYGVNIILEKLKEDRDFGISLDDQPYAVLEEEEIPHQPRKKKEHLLSAKSQFYSVAPLPLILPFIDPLVLSSLVIAIFGFILIFYRHQIIEFAQRIRAPNGFKAISNALCRPQKILPPHFKTLENNHPLKLSLDKKELDKFINLLTQGQRRQLFKRLDNLAQKTGFENLNINSRYAFVKLLTSGDFYLVNSSRSLSEKVKGELRALFENQASSAFADIAKHIILPILEKGGYSNFNNALPLINMPKVLLIASYMRQDIRTGLFLAPHLGLYRIASFLELFGIQADVYDVNLSGKAWLEQMVKDGQYDFIGFEVLHPALKDNLELIYQMHKLSPNSILVAGGQGATFDRSLLLEKTPINIVVTGFGEFPLLNIIITFDKDRLINSQFSQIKGIYLKSEDGNVISTGLVSPYSEDDLRVVSLGLNFTKIPYGEYWQAVEEMYSHNHMKMMKGETKTIRLYNESHCPMGCDFCSSTRFLDDAIGTTQKVRILSAKDILLLLKRAIKAHPDAEAFYFNDDDFLISRKRILELCELIERDLKEYGLKFICMSRADRVDFELLSKMRQAGFKIVSYGIESFSDKILRDIGKKLKSNGNGKVTEQAVRETFRAGIIPRINLIMFYPTTTIEDLRITIDKAVELINEGAPPTYYNYVEPYPGASILSKGYEMKYKKFEIEGNKFKIPVEIIPVNKEIKQLAEEAIALKPQIIQQVKNKYNWPYPTLPSSVDTLVFFFAIYKKANISTARIEEVIDRLIRMNNNSEDDQISKYTPQNIEFVIEALEELEYKTKEVITLTKQILLSERQKGSLKIQEAIKVLKGGIERIRDSLKEDPLVKLDEVFFEDLPQENAFGESDKPVLPRVVYKSLLPTLNFAKKELELISERPDTKIRSLLLINGDRKLQVGSRGFDFIESKAWQGWMLSPKSTSKKYVYKDLIIEEIPGLLSGLAQDLRVTVRIMKEKGLSINEAFIQARKRRAAIIERGVSLYEGWEPTERSFVTLKARYTVPLIKTSLILLAALAGWGCFFTRSPLLFSLHAIDTAISWSLLGLMGYIVYLSIYGLFSESGRFRISKYDLIEALPNTSLTNEEIISRLNKKEFFDLISNSITNISLLINNLPKDKLKDILLNNGINVDNLSKKEMSSQVLKIATDLFQRSKSLNNDEQKILQKIFPQQAIIIPAVNDPNIIELVSQKVALVDYPNVIFFLALEERDKTTLALIKKAQSEGKLPANVIPYFGPVLGPNEPGEQHKPLSKPKTVNNTLAQIQAIVEGLIENSPVQLNSFPDFMMIWDLEDEPAKLQIWSMIIADAMIKSTYEDLIERMRTEDGLKPDRIAPTILKIRDSELYMRASRWGIDLRLPKKLKRTYVSALKQLGNKDSDPEVRSLKLIRRIGVKSDVALLNQVFRGYEESRFIKKRNHKYDPDNKKLMENYDRILQDLSRKYSSPEQFILSEFERRTIPANYEGILIAKMFGENPLSHLEWLLWFNLILPGLAAFRFDKTIIPTAIAGSILGAVFGGYSGALAGFTAGSILGYFIGRLYLTSGIDFRNKTSFNFSAGTSQNFSFKTLIYRLSAYPEYNVAEDWSVGLKMAKMGFRTILIDGYKTPTYEDSLPPLGIRFKTSFRWWIQHSRWIGGHFQSIPQLFTNLFKSIKEFGITNFFHATVCVVMLSFSSILFGYVVFRTLLWVITFGIANFVHIPTLSILSSELLRDFDVLFFRPFDNPLLNAFLFILGPAVITTLTMFAILKERPDEEELIEKSTSDLKRIVDELKNKTNPDIMTVLQTAQDLDDIADELEAEGNSGVLQNIAESLEQTGLINIKTGKNIGRDLWRDPKVKPLLVKKFRVLSKKECPWKELRNMANSIKERLDREIQGEITGVENKIKKIEQGYLSLGKMRYNRLKKLMMSFGMWFYYFHTLPATLLYLRQIAKGMDSQWRQTPHRTYGGKFINIVADVLKKEVYNNNQNTNKGGHLMKSNILRFILVFFFLLANIEIGWTKNNPKTEEQPAYISQTDAPEIKKHTVDESVFISREKLAINNIVANAQKISQFERLELMLDLSATYDNPFDPDDINVEGHFISPDGKHIAVPGFFFQDYIRDGVGTTERLTLQDKPCFKVRFANKQKGKWQYYITVRDRSGELKSDIQTFEVVDGNDAGYISRSKRNNYLEFNSGKPYFAVGESIGWANRNKQTYDYDYFFSKLAENKCNYSRVWMVPWHLALEWTNRGWPKGKFFGAGKYCLENAWRFDYILKLAEEKGIYLMLTLGNYGDLMQEQGIWNEQMWEYNPYNIANGGPCKTPWDFFANGQAKDYYKKRLRYIIARWGYSPNLLSFELFNEVDAPEDWVREMAKFIKDNDPFGHMVTISFGYPDWLIKHPEEGKIWQLPEIDYTQLHIWGRQDKPQDLIAQLVSETITQTKSFGKPCLIAEFGIDSSKDDRFYDKEGKGINLHNGLWSATMSGSFGGAVNWWWDSYVEPNDLYCQHKALANFVEGVNWPKEWTLAKVSFLQKRLLDKKIRILGLTTDDEAILWIQNKESNWYNNYQGLQPPTLKNFSFYLLGLSDNNYKLEWWDTWNGEIVKETKASCINGKLLIKVPQVKSDLAIKIKRISEDAVLNSQLSLFGPFAKTLFSLNNENNIILTPQAALAINTLSDAYNGLTLEIDTDNLIDTSKGFPQLKGIGFKEAVASLYQAQENKEIPENLRIRLININSQLNREKIIKVLGLTEDLLKELVDIPEIPQDYIIKSLEPYLIAGSIRVIFEDNLKYWGKKVDVLVRRGKESETLSSLGLIVAALAKEPKFYESLPQEVKDYIVAVTDEKGNIALDDENNIKQLIFKPIEKTKVDTQYLEQLNKANKELEGMV